METDLGPRNTFCLDFVSRAAASCFPWATRAHYQRPEMMEESSLRAPPCQRQIMGLVLAGHPSKNIAADLRISQRTVENHRASIMKRTGTRSLPAPARLALAAAGNGADAPVAHATAPVVGAR
jgi:FixJ family two-component response regulator